MFKTLLQRFIGRRPKHVSSGVALPAETVPFSAGEPLSISGGVLDALPLQLATIDVETASGVSSSIASRVDRRTGIAHIELVGPIWRTASVYSRFYPSVAADEVIDVVRDFATDDAVKAIVLRIDSPGGSLQAGLALADAVHEARYAKRIIAQIDGCTLGAAYAVASQAHEIVAGKRDRVGDIGAVLALADVSRLFDRRGIETVVLTTGAHKGTGVPGAKITEAQRKELQATIDGWGEMFRESIQRGRGDRISATQLADAADGRIFFASDALALGLIDRIIGETNVNTGGNVERSRRRATASVGARTATNAFRKETIPMTTTRTDPIAAWDAAIAAKMEAGATKSDAIMALASEQPELHAAYINAFNARASRAPSIGANTGGDSIARWEAALAAKVESGMKRDAAIAALAAEQPELHSAYLREFNAQRRQRATG